MDLSQLLLHTFNPNREPREAATATIEKLGPTEGFAVSLLQAVTLAEVETHVKQAAAVNFKNIVVKHWADSRPVRLCASDKAIIKDNIVEVVSASPNIIRMPVLDALKEVIKRDFPDNWDGIVPKVMGFITSDDILMVTGGLLVARLLFKKYSFKSDLSGGREPLFALSELVLPAVGPIFERVIAMDSPEAGALCVLVAKILFCCVQSGIPPYFYTVDQAAPWMSMLLTLMGKDLTDEEPEEYSDRPSYVWWKAKKWVIHCFTRLHSRNASVDKAARKWPDTVAFARVFSSSYAGAFLTTCLHVTSGRHRHRGTIPGQIMTLIVSYINSAIRFSVTYKEFRPHMEAFMAHVLFPVFCFNERDEELWQDDPAELVRRDSDLMEGFYDPRLAAVNLILDLLQHRGRESLRMMMSHVVRVLSTYQAATPRERDYPSKAGAMYILGHMCTKLKELPEYKDGLPDLLLVHILPELSCPVGFVRSRACWVFGQFFDVEYSTPEPFLQGLQTILNLLLDEELPVRIRAAISLRFLILNPHAHEPLKGFLPQILEALFAMMNEIDVEDLIQTLQICILKFSDDIGPYAEALCAKLSENFVRMMSGEDDDDLTAGAAYEVLSALQIILSSVSKDSALLSRIETVLMPLLVTLFEPDYYEFFEDSLKLLTELVYFAPSISENMWRIFPLLYRAFDSFAFDWVDHMLMPIDNFIRKDTRTFLSGPHEMVFAMFKKLVSDPMISDYEAGEGATLIELVIHNCFPHITAAIPEILGVCIGRYFNEATEKFALKATLMGIVLNVMYFDPQLAVEVLVSHGCLSQTLSAMFELVMHKHYTRIRDLKLAILGLSSILRLPTASLPPELHSELLTLVRIVLTLQYKLAESRVKVAEEEKELESRPARIPVSDPAASHLEPVHEDRDVGGESLAELSERAREFIAAHADEDSDDDDMFDEDDHLEGTPMADVDEVSFFVAVLEEFVGREGDVGGSLLGGLAAEEQTYLASLQEHARLAGH